MQADFAADEYLDSPIAFDNGTVISLVHTEFPGNRYNNSGGPNASYCTGPAYPDCWTVSVGQVISHVGERSFLMQPPHRTISWQQSRTVTTKVSLLMAGAIQATS